MIGVARMSRCLSVAMQIVVVTIIAGCTSSIGNGFRVESLLGERTDVVPFGWRSRGVEWAIVFTDTLHAHTAPRCGGVALVDAFNKDRATLLQYFSAERYSGKRVRFSGYVKTHRVSQQAGLWMQVDSATRDAVEYDEMEGREIRGTTDWARYDVVLDVPPDASVITIGIFLEGGGQVWLDTCAFDVVDGSVATTGEFSPGRPPRYVTPRRLDGEPVNPSFDEEPLFDDER